MIIIIIVIIIIIINTNKGVLLDVLSYYNELQYVYKSRLLEITVQTLGLAYNL